MPRPNLRNLVNRWRAAGIGGSGQFAKYSDDIQLATLVDDFTTRAPFGYFNRIPDPIVPHYEVATNEPAPPVGRATVELIPGGRGAWVFALLHSTSVAANLRWWTIAAPRVPALNRIFTPTALTAGCYGDGRDSLAEFRVGKAPEDPPPNVQLRIALIATNSGDGRYAYDHPIYLAPGRVLTQQRIASNQDFNMGFEWVDIPFDEPTGRPR